MRPAPVRQGPARRLLRDQDRRPKNRPFSKPMRHTPCMAREERKGGMWGGRWTTVAVLLALAGAAAYASVDVEPASLPRGLRLDSGLLFHGAVVLVVFAVLYMFIGLVSTTIAHSGPPPKMSLGSLFAYESEAVAAMSQGATALEGIEQQIADINSQLRELVSVLRETQNALVSIADEANNEQVRDAAMRRIASLDQLAPAAKAEDQQRVARAIAEYRANVELLKQRRSARKAGNG
jgi:hypothetical protein